MPHLSRAATGAGSAALIAVVIFQPAPAGAQTDSDSICAAVRTQLAGTALPGPSFFAAASANSRSWKQVSAPFRAANLAAAANVDVLYVAYVRPTTFDAAGAVAVRIAVPAGEHGRPTNDVEVYRPAIARGLNRCEPKGRREIDRIVRLNRYIDYHSDAGGGIHSTLEDFHFSYPVYPRNCVRTDAGARRTTFAFGNDVTRTQGDTWAQRNLRFIRPAYAVTHKYARLRSELHYRPAAQLDVTCIGFTIPLKKNPATVSVTDHGFGSIWTIDRTLTIQR